MALTGYLTWYTVNSIKDWRKRNRLEHLGVVCAESLVMLREFEDQILELFRFDVVFGVGTQKLLGEPDNNGFHFKESDYQDLIRNRWIVLDQFTPKFNKYRELLVAYKIEGMEELFQQLWKARHELRVDQIMALGYFSDDKPGDRLERTRKAQTFPPEIERLCEAIKVKIRPFVQGVR